MTRNMRIAGVAALAAAGVILAGSVPYLLNSGAGPAGPDENAPVGVGTIGALECPEPSGGPGEPATGGSDPFVPDGAVAARLCPIPRKDLGMPAAASDITDLTLTQDVSTLAGHLNDLPNVPPPGELACHDDLGPTYDLVLAYPDRDHMVVTFEVFGCGTVRSDAGYRLDGQQLYRAYEQLAIAQMGGGADPELPCDTDGGEDGMAEPEEGFVPSGAGLVRLCRNEPGSPVDDRAVTPTLRDPDDRMTTLLNELPEPAGTECESAMPQDAVVLGYDGMVATVQLDSGPGDLTCVATHHMRQDANGIESWRVERIDSDGRVMALLDELATEQGGVQEDPLPLPDPDEPGDDGEPDAGDGPGDPNDTGTDTDEPGGGTEPSDPDGPSGPGGPVLDECPPYDGRRPIQPDGASGPGPIVPDGAVSLAVCVIPANPIDDRDLGPPRTRTDDDMADVIEFLNDLDGWRPDLACPRDIGPTYLLYFNYPDRTLLVEVETGGCGVVHADGEYRVGARMSNLPGKLQP